MKFGSFDSVLALTARFAFTTPLYMTQCSLVMALLYFNCMLSRRQIEREISIHLNLTHDNIISLFGAFEDDNNVYLVSDSHEDFVMN